MPKLITDSYKPGTFSAILSVASLEGGMTLQWSKGLRLVGLAKLVKSGLLVLKIRFNFLTPYPICKANRITKTIGMHMHFNMHVFD